MATYIVKPNQNIFDVSIHLYGTIEGIFDLLITNTWLNMNTDLQTGMELEYHEGFILNESVVSTLNSEGIIPSNGERHTYYKHPDDDLIAVCFISEELPMTSFIIGGEGTMLVDWGDNSDIERIILSHTNQRVTHYFDNTVESRRIKIYGDTSTLKLTYWNTTDMDSAIYITRPITVDEYVSHANGYTLSGLFLFEGTYRVDLTECTVSNLLPIGDMDLQELDLRKVHFTSTNVLDEYLQHVVTNYGTRRGCTVYLDTEPSDRGWAAINTILGESEWNNPTPWRFIINGITYTYTS